MKRKITLKRIDGVTAIYRVIGDITVNEHFIEFTDINNVHIKARLGKENLISYKIEEDI